MAKYQAYAEYKDSGAEWLGSIPKHWSVEYSKWLFEERNIKANVGDEMLTASQKYGVIPQKMFMELEQQKVVQVQLGHEILKRAEVNDFVISMRSFQGGIEYCGYKGAVSSAYVPLKPRQDLSISYYKYLFKSIPYIQALQTTTNLVRDGQALRFANFIQVRIPLLPYSEAEKIGQFLDHETAKIDHLIEKQQQLIELLKEKSQAVISHAVTKGLNPNVPMKDSGVEWLGEVPEHWQVGRIKHLAQIISKGTTPTTMGGDFVEEGIRFLKAENIGKGFRVNNYPEFFISEKVDEQLARSRLKEHDVLVIIAGATTGLASVLQKELLPANTNQAVSFIRLLNFNYSHWVSHWLTTQFAQSVIWMGAVQAAQPNLSMESLGNIYIAIPPVEEVIEILKDIEFKLESFESLINKTQQQISLMQERRTALISAAVTGKIDVRNWQAPTVAEADTELSA
ncbi:restriction endonuclease subunit S [Acinetobacter sp. YH12136]|uniref:restriction endonuclease subunit S n=1 Tax=Acinetobacter sp. YH12136 TaxID=2601120 RepID=UPI0015D179A4|nr:restriction endonuclease subunit S [Acinetobacter sp. YH12136]